MEKGKTKKRNNQGGSIGVRRAYFCCSREPGLFPMRCVFTSDLSSVFRRIYRDSSILVHVF